MDKAEALEALTTTRDRLVRERDTWLAYLAEDHGVVLTSTPFVLATEDCALALHLHIQGRRVIGITPVGTAPGLSNVTHLSKREAEHILSCIQKPTAYVVTFAMQLPTLRVEALNRLIPEFDALIATTSAS